MATPAAPMTPAKASACRGDSLPSGSGRRLVRSISASFFTSYSWFSAFADAAQAKVPSEVQASCAHCICSPLPAWACSALCPQRCIADFHRLQGYPCVVCLACASGSVRAGWRVALCSTCNEACCGGADDQGAEPELGQLLVELHQLWQRGCAPAGAGHPSCPRGRQGCSCCCRASCCAHGSLRCRKVTSAQWHARSAQLMSLPCEAVQCSPWQAAVCDCPQSVTAGKCCCVRVRQGCCSIQQPLMSPHTARARGEV
jgi:hypothetical protein